MSKNASIQFGKNTIESGIKALDYLQEAWDQEITLPPEHSDFTSRISKLEELIQKQDGVDFTTLVKTAPVDEWEDTLERELQSSTRRDFIQRNYTKARQALAEARAKTLNSAILYDHVMTQIDVEGAVTAFTEAALTLGENVNDIQKAVDQAPAAAAEFRKNGRKLFKLHQLLPTSYSVNGTQLTHPAAVYLEVADIEPLIRDMSQQRMAHKGYEYGDDLQYRHGAITMAVENKFTNGTTSQGLTEVAQGKHPDLTLNIATTLEQAQARTCALGAVGRVQRINDKAADASSGHTPAGLSTERHGKRANKAG
ncbi:MAG: hypothetical protein ACTH3N_07155 [Corynebacterium casei]|uniref:Uncharacterized protein n=1 Tax=Corynebacterium casei UCMA 3821 TaxID=1110505 RepID=G7HYN4_9CORY|nr:hypothetical protein [Corynebacterium casei]CCE55299.1 putative uncharacterized protein [Corynebacterium casei UCMA 3821]